MVRNNKDVEAEGKRSERDRVYSGLQTKNKFRWKIKAVSTVRNKKHGEQNADGRMFAVLGIYESFIYSENVLGVLICPE